MYGVNIDLPSLAFSHLCCAESGGDRGMADGQFSAAGSLSQLSHRHQELLRVSAPLQADLPPHVVIPCNGLHCAVGQTRRLGKYLCPI